MTDQQKSDLFDSIFESGLYDTGAHVAEWHPYFNTYSANSQYGYVISWHATREWALIAARSYYDSRRELIFQ